MMLKRDAAYALCCVQNVEHKQICSIVTVSIRLTSAPALWLSSTGLTGCSFISMLLFIFIGFFSPGSRPLLLGVLKRALDILWYWFKCGEQLPLSSAKVFAARSNLAHAKRGEHSHLNI